MIPVFQIIHLLETKMKKAGIPIGDYKAVADAAGKMKVKPKRKAMGAATEIAKRKRKKWRPAK